MDRKLDGYLKDREVAEFLSVSRGHVWRMVQTGVLPKPVAIGAATRWRVSDIEAAIKARAERETAAAA